MHIDSSKPDTQYQIGVVTTPSQDESFAEPVYRFLDILAPSAKRLTIFAGGVVPSGICETGGREVVNTGDGEYIGISILDFFLLQLAISYHIVRVRKKLDIIYFHKGTMGLLIPIIIARLLGIRTGGIKIGAYFDRRQRKVTILSRFITVIQYLSFRAAHGAIVFTESERVTVPNDRVFVGYSNYRDFKAFSRETSIEERGYDIGFVGRFDEVKGIYELVPAVQSLVDEDQNIRAAIIGDGSSFGYVLEALGEKENIEIKGWVEHQTLPDYLNDIRLLFVPSEAEGLPTTVIEAMGTGVIVVASPVGSVPDLITHGKTGFLMENNTSECIKNAFREYASRDDLEEISKRARQYAVKNYSLAAAQERFARISDQL